MIAKEVRKLENESKKSTDQIHVGAEDIIKQISTISKGTLESEKTIKKSNQRIEQALYEFRDISEAAKVLDVQADNLVDELHI